MSDAQTRRPSVSIVIVPRERFGMAKTSLDSVLAETPEPYELVYVSGRSPAHLIAHIDAKAAEHGFRHIKLDRLLAPNEARNVGLAASRGDYVVFLDNDVLCAPGWLPPLVACAEETGADVVAPLTCQGLPAHGVVHQAGGLFAQDPAAFFATPKGWRDVIDVMHHENEKVADVALTRGETQLCEFHAVLARRALFDRIGPLDENMLATKEHLDFCMSVVQAGGKVMIEPASVVTYVFPNRHNPVTREDMDFFLVRWSPEWQKRSLRHFQAKWGLRDDGYLESRERQLGMRHNLGVVRPIVAKIPVVGRMSVVQRAGRRLLLPLVKRWSDRLVAREDRLRAKAPRAAGGAVAAE
jgi:glycosyltransferase involved in cell wall biosynthesis